MVDRDLLLLAGEESVKFIDSMRPDELGIYTIRKAFEMGYLHGANDTLKDVEELKDLEAVVADQAMTIAMMKSEQAEKQKLVAYPNGVVVGPCICGSWPGGKCSKCPVQDDPQSEWVGLTNADIAHAMYGNVVASNMLPYQFARAIEAKLREKNT